jgi:hypothetical protein
MGKLPSPKECPELYDDFDFPNPPKDWVPVKLSERVDRLIAERKATLAKAKNVAPE